MLRSFPLFPFLFPPTFSIISHDNIYVAQLLLSRIGDNTKPAKRHTSTILQLFYSFTKMQYSCQKMFLFLK